MYDESDDLDENRQRDSRRQWRLPVHGPCGGNAKKLLLPAARNVTAHSSGGFTLKRTVGPRVLETIRLWLLRRRRRSRASGARREASATATQTAAIPRIHQSSPLCDICS